MNLRFESFAISDKGLVKTENQDASLVLEPRSDDRGRPGPSLFAVSDGMGGERGGRLAATLAVTTLAGFFANPPAAPGDPDDPARLETLLGQAVLAADAAIRREADLNPEHRYMGATLTVLAVQGTRAVVAHVGDSRLYLWRDGGLAAKTRDHRFLDELVAAGDMTREEADRHPLRHQLDMALGAPGCRPEVSAFDLAPGDRLILCSDGLTDEIDEAALADALARGLPPEATAPRLVRAALEHGGRDNVTVIVADAIDPATPAAVASTCPRLGAP